MPQETTDQRDYLLPFVVTMEKVLHVRRTTAYKLVKQGKIRIVRVGGKTLIRKSEIDRVMRDGT